MEWLVRERTRPRDCFLSWAELYTSLCVTDRASPGFQLCVISLMWGMCAESVLEVCQTFVSLSLATLSTGAMEKRMVNLHDLQFEYCGDQCSRALTPSLNSARFLLPECMWHMRILEGLLAKTAVPMVLDNSTDGSLCICDPRLTLNRLSFMRYLGWGRINRDWSVSQILKIPYSNRGR
jgi:hypothetical protein